AAVEGEEQVLAPPVDPRDLVARELAREVLLVGVAANRAHARDLHLLDAFAHHLALQVSAEGLDFRELGHQLSSSPSGLLAVAGASRGGAPATRPAPTAR